MIHEPKNVAFYIPQVVEALDLTAEPTLEGLAGQDVLGDTIADAGVIVGAWDGRPKFRPRIDTNGVATVWRVDAALNSLQPLDFVLLDRHSLLTSYAAAIRSNINAMSHTADVVGSATAVTRSKIISGLPGRVRPRLGFGGADSIAITGGDQTRNHTNDFSIGVIYNSEEDTSGAEIITMLDGNDDGWRMIFFSDGNVWCSLNTVDVKTTSGILNDGNDHMVLFVADRDGNGQIYTDGVADGPAIAITSVPTMAITTAVVTIGNASVMNGKSFRLWNRILSAAEAATLYASWTHTPIPILDQYASQTAVYISDFSADVDGWERGTADANFVLTGNVDGVDGVDDTLECHADGGDVEMYIKKVTDTELVAGYYYRMTFSYYVDAGSGLAFLGVGTTTTRRPNPVGGVDGIAISAGSWQAGVVIDFVAGDALGRISAYTTAEGSTIDELLDGKKIYFKDITFTRIGCVAEYPHDGISPAQGKWLDASGNALHGTITGCEYINAPTTDNPGFYLQTITEIERLFLFTQFNPDGLTALANTYLGWLVWGLTYTFSELASVGLPGNLAWPGINLSETDAGVILAEEDFGERPGWTVTITPQNQANWETIQAMIRILHGSLYPFYVCWDTEDDDPVLWRVRAGIVTYMYLTDDYPWQSIKFTLTAE